MIPLGTSGAVLGSHAAAALRDAALLRYDAPQGNCVRRTLGDAHPQGAGGPVCNAAGWESHREPFDEAVSRQMHDGAMARNPHGTDRPVARPIGINQAIGVQLGQPLPGQ